MICLLPKRLRWSTGWNDAPCWGVRQALPTLTTFYVPSVLCSTPPPVSQMLDCKRYNGVNCTYQLRVWCWSCTCVSSWCSLQGWLGIKKGSYLLVVNFVLFQQDQMCVIHLFQMKESLIRKCSLGPRGPDSQSSLFTRWCRKKFI